MHVLKGLVMKMMRMMVEMVDGIVVMNGVRITMMMMGVMMEIMKDM